MEKNEECMICPAEATWYFDRSRVWPLCDNPTCEVATVGQLNSLLLSEDAEDFNEGATP